MARGLRIRLGITEDEKVKQQLLSAGIRTSQGMNTYVASRYVGPVLGLVCGSLIHTNTVFWALSLAAVFYLIPDMWLKTKDQETERKDQEEHSRRTRSAGDLRRGRVGFGPGDAARGTGARSSATLIFTTSSCK